MKPIRRILSYVLDRGRVRMRIRWNGDEMMVSTGCNVDRVNSKGKAIWDGRRCIPNSRHGVRKVLGVEINRMLDYLEDEISKIFYEFEISNHMPTISEVRELLRPEKKPKVTFEQSYLQFIIDGEKHRDWATNTVKSVRQVKNLVLKFDSDVTLADIDEKWLDSFVEYQKRHKLSDKKYSTGSDGFSNSVIQKNCRVLRWFLKWAAEKKLVSSSLAENFHPHLKTIRKPVIFLTWEELMRVYNLQLPIGSWLDKARDLFCFQSFTSLRYSDIAFLSPDQVGEDVIRIVTVKTATTLEIDLNKYSRSILNKYSGIYSDRALPYLTNFQLNYYIKQVGKLAEINETISISQYYGSDRVVERRPKWDLLSSHAGRRTFICNALALGISPNIVMKWTGHSEYSAMRPYIDIADSIRKKSMGLFDKL